MTTFSEGRERNAALGVWGAVGAFGAVAGVLLGGRAHRSPELGVDLLHQRSRRPGRPGADAAAAPESRDAHVKTFDALGAVLVTSGLVTLVFAITQANDFGWSSPETIGLFAGAGVLLAAFVGWELRAKEPLVPFGIFKVKTLTARIAGLILGTVTFSMFLMLTLYMQQVLGYSPMKTGVAYYLAVAGTAILWSSVAAQLVNRVGVKPVIAAGMTLLTVALLFFTQISVDGSYVSDLLPGFLLIGAGLGFRSCRSRSRRWPASGLRGGARLRSLQHVAAGRRRAGLAALSAIATSTTSNAVSTGTSTPQALVDGFEAAFIVGAAVAAAGIIVALVLVRRSELVNRRGARGSSAAGARSRLERSKQVQQLTGAVHDQVGLGEQPRVHLR